MRAGFKKLKNKVINSATYLNSDKKMTTYYGDFLIMLDFAIKCKHPIYNLDMLYEAYEKNFVEIIDLINAESTNISNYDVFCKLDFPYKKIPFLVGTKLNPDDYFLVADCDLETKINIFIRKFNPDVPWIRSYCVKKFFYLMIVEKIKNTLVFFHDNDCVITYTRVKYEPYGISNIDSDNPKKILFESSIFLHGNSFEIQRRVSHLNYLVKVNICSMLDRGPIKNILGVKSCEGDAKKLLNALFIYLSGSHAPMLIFDIIYEATLGLTWNEISKEIFNFLGDGANFRLDSVYDPTCFKHDIKISMFLSGLLRFRFQTCFLNDGVADYFCEHFQNWIIHLIAEKTRRLISYGRLSFSPYGRIIYE